MKKSLIIFAVFLLIAILGFSLGVPYYINNYSPNVTKTTHIYIPTGSTYKQVEEITTPYLNNVKAFNKVAKSEKYIDNIKAGRYKINEGETAKEVVRRLLLGQQDVVHLRIKAYDDIYELSGGIGKNLEGDSLTFLNYFKKVALQKGLADVEELKIFFTPETYFMDWNTTPTQLFNRFEKIHTDFWTKERYKKAQNLGLDKMEIYTLASIVQREFMKKDELATIASLYLNRLNKDMKLQSDPTVIYAERKAKGFKIIIRRVKNLSIDSPYNTYKYKGLPPLPIAIPNDFVVDAVLNPAETNYIFMCAIRNTGRHAFTASDVEHMKNAKEYREWLDSKGIK